MSAFFASASSQKLTNAAPLITAMPFSVGFWVYPTTTGTLRYFWSLADTAAATNYHAIGQGSSNLWRLEQTDDATPISAENGTVTANQWAYVVARFISATSRLMSVWQFNGSIANLANTTNDSPAGIDTMALGCLNHSAPANFFDGRIAEFWCTNTDIQANGGTMQAPLLHQLARGGPFSVPHIAKNIVEYRSFRKHPLVGDAEDIHFGASGVQNWTNTGAVTTAPHPPLPYWYRKPKEVAVLQRRIPKIVKAPAPAAGRIMSALAKHGGLAWSGGLAGSHGGLAA